MNRPKMANLLIELRKNKDLTQQDVAELFYVSPQAVSKWEKGDSIPDIETLEKLSKFYQISIEEILNGEINQKENIGVLDENSNSGDIKTTTSTPKKVSVPGIVIYSVSLCAFFIFLFAIKITILRFYLLIYKRRIQSNISRLISRHSYFKQL